MSELALKNDMTIDQLDLVDLFLKVRKRSIIDFFPHRDVKSLLDGDVSIVSAGPGEVLDVSYKTDALYVCVEGSASFRSRVTKAPVNKNVTFGRTFELDKYLLAADRWQYEWVASEEGVKAIRISRATLKPIFDANPDVVLYLERLSTLSEFRALKRGLRFLGVNQKKIIKILVSAVEIPAQEIPRSFSEGKLIVVSNGRVVVKAEFRRQSHNVGAFEEGDYFFLEEGEPRYKFQASPDTTAWFVDEKILKENLQESDFQAFVTAASKPKQRMDGIVSIANAPRASSFELTAVEDESDLEFKDFETGEQAKKFGFFRRTYPHVKQHDRMDCGAACLAMIARAYGKAISLADVRYHVSVTREGASMMSLKKGADALGIESIGVFSPLKGLENAKLPFIALMEYHFVVVYKVTADMVIFGDPGIGIREMPRKEFEKAFSKNAMLCRPTKAFEDYPSSRPSYLKYLKIFKGHRKVLLYIVAMSLVSFVFGLVTPILNQLIFDNVFTSKSSETLTLLIAASVVMTILANIVAIVSQYLNTHLVSVADAKFSALFLRQTYHLPLSYFSVRNVADFTSRHGELGRLRGFMANKPIQMAMRFLSIFVYGGFLFLYNAKLLYIAMGFLPLFACYILYVTPRIMKLNGEVYSKALKSRSLLIEHVRGINTIKAIAGGIAARWRWQTSRIKFLNDSERIVKFDATMDTVNSVLHELLTQVIFVVSLIFVMRNELTIGQLIACGMLVQSAIQPIIETLHEWTEFSKIGVAFGRVDDVVTAAAEPSSITSSAGGKENYSFEGPVEFDKVSFRYGSEASPEVLKSVSFRIEPGETVAIVGKSGSGKTTLSYLLNLLYYPTTGQITIDGVPNTAIPTKVLRKKVAMILQEKILFKGSIIENIAVGEENPDFQKVVAAAKKADAHDFISKFESGYATMLGESGEGLSGGQKQRICIARALYSEPSILVMDEATSALDSITEGNVVRNLKVENSRRKTIIIAHRLETITHADKILVFDDGKVVEQGNHATLLANKGPYYQLFRRQLTG